ncbi:MAG TPA: hypothetical protein VN903_02720 [Polyangia bacterium]|jgi:hypothetical protein|nr:hypothetical protein [Polyangia bacterium]
MTRRKLAQVAAMAVLLAGCGGGGSSKPITEADFCSQKADAECQAADRCVNDKAACKTQRTTACTEFVATAKANNKRVFVPGNVGTCIAKVKAYYAKTTPITVADMNDMTDACNYVFQGSGKVNVDMCDTKYDCKDRVICDKMFCAVASAPKAVDQPCGNSGDVCAAGTFCSPNSAGNKVCMARIASGAACSETAPCLENLRCAAGTCMERVGMSGACMTNDDCATTAPFCDPYAMNRCDQGLSFSPGSLSCNDYGGGGSGTGTGGSGGGTGGTGGGGSAGGGTSGGAGTTGAGGATGTGGTGA